MKLKIPMRSIININEGLTTLKNRKPNISTSYKIAKNLHSVTEALNIYQTVEQDILSEHIDEEATNKLTQEERGNGRVIVKDARNYNIKINELDNTKHELDIEPITLEELEDNFGDMTPDTLFKLMPIIKE